MLIHEETFRLLLHIYVAEDASVLKEIEDGNELSAIIAKNFCEYLQRKCKTTKDQRLLYIMRFYLLTLWYKRYKISMNSGDAVAMEYIEVEFCPVFFILDKSKYVEVVLLQIERKYHSIIRRIENTRCM